MVRDSARAYAQDKLMPRVLEANRHEHFHREIMTEMGEMGLWGRPSMAMAAPASAMSAMA